MQRGKTIAIACVIGHPMVQTSLIFALLTSACVMASGCASTNDGGKTTTGSEPSASSSSQSAQGEPATGDGSAGSNTSKPAQSKSWEDETFNGLGPGTPEETVISKLGKPKERTKPIEEGATGDWVASLTFDGPAKGWAVQVAAPKQAGPYRVKSMSIDPPNTAKSTRGIGLGSTRQEVEAAYGQWKNQDMSSPERLVIGEWGGIRFYFEGDKVTSIFFGADGE